MQNSDIKVSVLVPVYNVEDLLPRCLDSIVNQTLKEIEIVCVNDASPDGSLKILEEYAERDPRIKVITHSNNMGLMMARRTGYQNALGRYVVFCDSDDFIPQDALEKLYDAATRTDADITVGALYMINEKGKRKLRPRYYVGGKSGKEYLRNILSGTTCSLCGSLFKREIFVSHDYLTLQNQTISEDRLLLTQILLGAEPSVTVITNPTYFYWINTQSITRRVLTKELLREQLKALFLSYDIVDKHSTELTRENNIFIIRYLTYYLEQVPWRYLIRDYNDTSRRLLKFHDIKRYAPAHLVYHSQLLLRVPFYRHIAWSGRKLLRKLQGKI